MDIITPQKVIEFLDTITQLRRENEELEHKLSVLIFRLTGGLYSKPSMTADEIMYEHDAWHERTED
jgi:hypothetical protein